MLSTGALARLLAVLTLVVAAGGLAAVTVARTPHAQAAGSLRVLFDNAHAETAGNADWVISTSQPDPTKQDASPNVETDWTGALSSWGVALQKTGRYTLATLPGGGALTYGDSSNAEDLSHYDELVLPEPNVLFTATEKTAIMTFVKNGGGLFMISDHTGSDRNNDGSDAVKILNDLMTNNSVDSTDPFGLSIDSLNIASENPNVIGASAGSDPIIKGPFGTVTGSIIRNGTTVTLKPADNSAARGELFRAGYSASGTTGAFVASSTFGSGREVFWGDSSPIDDGTGSPGNTLYDGWNDTEGTDAAIALNATEWLAGGGGGTTSPSASPSSSPSISPSAPAGGQLITNGGFESGGSGWSESSSAGYEIVTTTRPHTGSKSAYLCSTTSCTDSMAQRVAIPAGAHATLSFWSYLTTTETRHPYDFLRAQVLSPSGAVLGTVATVSDADPAGSWRQSTADLSSYAGQTVTLKLTSTDDAQDPTTFFLDDVSLTTT